jgi:hypothetical protein
VAELVISLHLEHAVCRKEAKNAAERVGVGAYGRCEVGGGSGRLVQRVCDAEVCGHVKASRQAIASRHLLHSIERI